MMVVETSTSASLRTNFSITFSSSDSRIWPCPTTTRAFGTSRLTSAAKRGNRFHAVVNEKNLAVARQLLFDDALDERLAEGSDGGLNREAVFRRRFDHAHIPQAHQRHVQSARNRRGRHGEHRDILAHLLEALFVRHAEALLFVDDQQAEVLKLDVLGEEPVRADHDIHFPGFELFERLLLLLFGAEPAEHFDAHGKRRKAPAESLVVLKSEHGGRRQHGDLLGIRDGLECGAHGHFRLAVADVAAKQAVHRGGGFHVALHVVDGPQLVGRFLELEGVFKFALPIRIGGNAWPTAVLRSA